MSLLFIALHDIELFGFHGVYEEEQVLGNTFIINIKVGIEANTPITHLNQTVNYEKLLSITQHCFKHTRPLLEELLLDIESNIISEFPVIRRMSISIKKSKPPLAAQVAFSEVSLDKDYTN